MEKNSYDIETCTWCNGAGFNQAFNGKANPPNCVRCEGSGKIYVKDELATTKSRRKYMGPVPKENIMPKVINESLIAGELGTFTDVTIITEPKKRRGRPPKVASGNHPAE